jgi:hypothetical protein
MTNLSITGFIVLSAFIAGCNSQVTNKEPKIGAKEKDTTATTSTLNSVDKNRDSAIIYDTVVFTDNMNGELLNEKFASGQPELKFYKRFINSNKINELIVLKEKDVKKEIKYLGEIKDLSNKASYHVITNFKVIGIGEMLSPRGKSDLAFVNEAKNKIIIYNLPMPQNLPKYIKNQCFVL